MTAHRHVQLFGARAVGQHRTVLARPVLRRLLDRRDGIPDGHGPQAQRQQHAPAARTRWCPRSTPRRASYSRAPAARRSTRRCAFRSQERYQTAREWLEDLRARGARAQAGRSSRLWWSCGAARRRRGGRAPVSSRRCMRRPPPKPRRAAAPPPSARRRARCCATVRVVPRWSSCPKGEFAQGGAGNTRRERRAAAPQGGHRRRFRGRAASK